MRLQILDPENKPFFGSECLAIIISFYEFCGVGGGVTAWRLEEAEELGDKKELAFCRGKRGKIKEAKK